MAAVIIYVFFCACGTLGMFTKDDPLLAKIVFFILSPMYFPLALGNSIRDIYKNTLK
jgi:hypothetical protein